VWRHALTQQHTTQAMLCPQGHVHSMTVLSQGVSCAPTDLQIYIYAGVQLCGCAAMQVCNYAVLGPSFAGFVKFAAVTPHA
jgi:hypothetical protein